MEKYVIPPFYFSDFKFPSVNKALLKEVKIIFAELTEPAGLLCIPPCSLSGERIVECFTDTRAVSSNGSWRFLLSRHSGGSLAAKKN